MLLIPAGVVVLVTLYCLACVLHPGWRADGSFGVDLGHAVMGVTMVAMLLDVLPATWAHGRSSSSAARSWAAAYPLSTAASPVVGAHQLMASAADTTMSSAGRVIDLLVIAALLALAAARLAGTSRAGQSLHCHLHAVCDVAMAATTGCMLAAML